MTNEDFIKIAKNKFNERYIYSMVEYTHSHDKIDIICREHGVFSITACSHTHKNKDTGHCPACTKIKRARYYKKKHSKKFIDDSKKLHNNKYDYSLIKYYSNQSFVDVICPDHGIFNLKVTSHLSGSGCPSCLDEIKIERLKLKYIKLSNELYKGKYNYSLVNFVNIDTAVDIICPIHGTFQQSLKNHISTGCKECHKEMSLLLNSEKFIESANEIHRNRYDYSLVNYIHAKSKVSIVCDKHGVFNQTPNNHLRQKGCPKCSYETNGGSYSHMRLSDLMNIDGYFYIVLLTNENNSELFYKAGVTKLQDMSRFRHYTPYQVIDVICFIDTLNMANAITLEKTFLNSVQKYRPLMYFGGGGECFTHNS